MVIYTVSDEVLRELHRKMWSRLAVSPALAPEDTQEMLLFPGWTHNTFFCEKARREAPRAISGGAVRNYCEWCPVTWPATSHTHETPCLNSVYGEYLRARGNYFYWLRLGDEPGMFMAAERVRTAAREIRRLWTAKL